MPNYEEIRKHRNELNRFTRYVGIDTVVISNGYAKSIMEIRPEHGNPIGSIHGGAIFTLADTCAGAAASSDGIMHTTVSSNMNYMRPVMNQTTLIAEANRIKNGKTLSVITVDIKNSEGTVFATATFTYFSLNKPILLESI